MTDKITYADVFGMPSERADQPEAGAYRARLVSNDVIQKNKAGSDYRIWTFKVEDSDIVVSGTSSLFIGPESKTYQWATALLGKEPARGMGLKDLIGLPATIVTAMKENGYAKVVSVQPWPEGRTDAQIIPDEPLVF